MAGIVVVFDFDKTIIDCDSDNWVIDDLGGTERFDELLLTLPWNSAMDKIMGEFHSQGKSIEQIKDVLERAPLYPNTISAIKSAYALGCELRILSDANIFYIETILHHHNLMHYFSEIISNPSYVDNEGRLRISPYHDFNTSSHGCGLGICPPNMCKGKIMENIKESIYKEGTKQRLIYLGDGKGDYCPCLKLSEKDQVMPRKNYPLWDLIYTDQNDNLKAQIHDWKDAMELERVLLSLVQIKNSSVQIIESTCHALMPGTSHEVLPKAVHVPN